MKGVNDKAFLNLWQLIYRTTNPSMTNDHWQVADVTWRKWRHHFGGDDYSFSIETHMLDCAGRGRSPWTLIVVIEHWWDSRHEPIKTQIWARPLSGGKQSILNWFRAQGRIHGVSA